MRLVWVETWGDGSELAWLLGIFRVQCYVIHLFQSLSVSLVRYPSINKFWDVFSDMDYHFFDCISGHAHLVS
jgi:hypothetical protein